MNRMSPRLDSFDSTHSRAFVRLPPFDDGFITCELHKISAISLRAAAAAAAAVRTFGTCISIRERFARDDWRSFINLRSHSSNFFLTSTFRQYNLSAKPTEGPIPYHTVSRINPFDQD